MAMIDPVLQTLLIMHGYTNSPYGLIMLAFLAAYLGGLVMERIPFTRRIIERREAAARESGQ
ncbi:hypothetical protein [Streptosporangium sp. KLBMP 9127]|nr:hypothetical protein [Streptosporangium sp. KLBMP 9127]